MGQVQTNNTALQYAIELTETNPALIGVLPGEQGQPGTPTWYGLEPNSYGAIGADITTVARNPISPNRQRRKGTITDLDSSSEFEADLTMSHFQDFAEGFVFSRFIGIESYIPSSVDTDSYTVAAGTALSEGTLIYARGFSNSANNGLKNVGTGSTTTDIVVIETLTLEATVPNNAVIEVAGFRTSAGDLDVTAINANEITITSASNILNNSSLGLTPGSAIFFGGESVINRFSTAGNHGYGEIVSVATDGSQIVINNVQQSWSVESNTTQEVDFYVGKFLRNVSQIMRIF